MFKPLAGEGFPDFTKVLHACQGWATDRLKRRHYSQEKNEYERRATDRGAGGGNGASGPAGGPAALGPRRLAGRRGVEVLARHDVTISHNPASNLMLGNWLMLCRCVRRMLRVWLQSRRWTFRCSMQAPSTSTP
jgi:hypothetical protein